jgi:magnesium chelatase family protein
MTFGIQLKVIDDQPFPQFQMVEAVTPICAATFFWYNPSSRRRQLSGPLLDRIDLHIEVPRVPHKDLTDPLDAEPSSAIRGRVETARQLQRQRLAPFSLYSNSRMQARHIRKFCLVDESGHKLLEMVTDRLGLSARSYSRILKVARTTADLAGEEHIHQPYLAEAIQYRGLDRKVG